MYEDDQDNAEDVVYTGQGGHNLTGDKRQIRDQKLERGNLALKVCHFCDLSILIYFLIISFSFLASIMDCIIQSQELWFVQWDDYIILCKLFVVLWHVSRIL